MRDGPDYFEVGVGLRRVRDEGREGNGLDVVPSEGTRDPCLES